MFISPFLSYWLPPQPHIFPTGTNTENLETERSGLVQKAEAALCCIHAQREVGPGSCEESGSERWVTLGHREDFDNLCLTLVFLVFLREMMISEDVLSCHSWADGWVCYWPW